MSARIESTEFLGLPAWRLFSASGASAVVTRYGAQVVSWSAADGDERLYCSPRAVYQPGRALRAGVPVSFPQFASLGALPKHGLVRTRDWAFAEQRIEKDYVMLTLRLEADEEKTPDLFGQWPHAFACELTVCLANERLDIEFEVENTGDAAFEFTAALHTYLTVTDLEDLTLSGLRGCEYRDAADNDLIKQEKGDVVVIRNEVDRVYHGASAPLLLNDPAFSLGLHQEGFADVVVWNPGPEKCAALADMPANGWEKMLCIEAAAVQTPVSLPPGEAWWGRQTLLAMRAALAAAGE